MRRCSLILTTAQIQMLHGASARSAQRMMTDIRRYFKKRIHQSVTVEEYAQYHKIPVEHVREALKRVYKF